MNVLKRIGIPIVEHCNLNCKGCLHFCNLFQDEFCYDCAEYEQDLKRLSGFFDNIEVIRLYGGEPLLHPDLVKLLGITSKYLKHTKIELLTNGLLLPHMDDNFYNSIRKLGVYIRWSSYPVGEKISEKIEDKLISEDITYCKNVVGEFYGMFNPHGNSDPDYQWKHCSGRECHVLSKGFISVCPAPAVEHIVNNSFGQKLNFSKSRLNIFEKDVDADKIAAFLGQAHDVCKYCSGVRTFKWGRQSRPVIEEWYGKGESDE